VARRLGGRQNLFQVGHNDFLHARSSVGRVVCASLQQLRLVLEHIEINDPLGGLLKQMLEAQAGTGYIEMMKAFMQRI
jgi:hypothetical protein